MRANEIHTIKGARRRKKRIGRGNGSGHGTTATRGTKGQRARTGGRSGLQRLGFKFILQRIPKKRGFKAIEEKPFVISLDTIAEKFENNAKVNLASLKGADLVPKTAVRIKIVGTKAEISKKFQFEDCVFTKGARIIVEKAGGSIK